MSGLKTDNGGNHRVPENKKSVTVISDIHLVLGRTLTIHDGEKESCVYLSLLVSRAFGAFSNESLHLNLGSQTLISSMYLRLEAIS